MSRIWSKPGGCTRILTWRKWSRRASSSMTACARAEAIRSLRSSSTKWMKSTRRRSKTKARPMRLGEPGRMQAAINITPLVDVVLVLLIIFMVMAPQMRKGPDVNLPNTTKPNSQGDERGRILVSIDEAGGLWINDQPVAAEHFDETLRAAVGAETNPKIVIRGDAKLNFREVREVMVAIEQTGFRGVGLIAKRAGAEGK